MSQAMDEINAKINELNEALAVERGQVRAIISELEQIKTQVESGVDKDAVVRALNDSIARAKDIAPDE